MGSGSSSKKKYKGKYADSDGEPLPDSPKLSKAATRHLVDHIVEPLDEPSTPESPAGRRSPRPEAAPVETSPRLGAARVEGHAERRLESVAESEAPNVERDEELDDRSASKAPSDPEPQHKPSEPTVVVAAVHSPKEDRGSPQAMHVQLPQSTSPQSQQESAVVKSRHRHSEMHGAFGGVGRQALEPLPEPHKAPKHHEPQLEPLAERRGSKQRGSIMEPVMEPLLQRRGSKQRDSLMEPVMEPLLQRRGSKQRGSLMEPMPERRGSKHGESHHRSPNHLSLPEGHEASHNVIHSVVDADHELGHHSDENELEHREVHHRRPSRASFMHHRLSMSENAESSSRRGSKGPTEAERSLSKRSSVIGADGNSRRGSKMMSVASGDSRRPSKMTQSSETEAPPLQVGDKVSTVDGPDADGPWRDMGNGIVQAMGKHAGTVIVKFESTGAEFEIKEKNLLELSVKDEKDKRKASKEKKYEVKIDGHIGDPNLGIKVGDTVAFSNGGRGVVVKEGITPGTVLVRFGELGIRSVQCNSVTKLRLSDDSEPVEDLAWKSRWVDPTQKKSYQLTLDEAMMTFQEQYDFEKAMAEKDKHAVDPNDPMKGLRPGDFVTVNDHGPWHDLGVGLVKGPGKHAGTAMVQFDCVGDMWTLKCEVLTKVKKLDVAWKKSRALDHGPRRRSKEKPSVASSAQGAES